VAEPAVVLAGAGLTLEDVGRVAIERAPLALDAEVAETLARSRAVVDRVVAGDRLVYGLNTGLGHMRDERVPMETLARYQVDMIEGHAAGLGEPLPDEDVRAIMVARIAGAARGGSGLHPEAVDVLVRMLNAGVHPLVPAFGSVGAADLMHMAAVAMVVIGRGEARVDGRVLPGAAALAEAAIDAYRPRPKDGIALVSANGASIGIGALAVLEAERVVAMADATAALTLDVLGGNPSPFDAEVALAKPLAGQVRSAETVRELIRGSSIAEPGAALSVQDPLSLRVVPQVHGALRDQVAAVRSATETELNSIGDNPMVSLERGALVSNGNFHPMALALAFEAVRVGIAHVAMLAERRMSKLMALWFADIVPGVDGPAPEGARRALAQYSAAAILAEVKHLAAPVTIHCPPLDLDVEDHATLAASAVALARRSLAHLETMLAAEAMMAVDALAAGRRAGRLGDGTSALAEAVRVACRELGPDDPPARRVDAVRAALRAGAGVLAG
jgi:histidine ammonia-lyase